MYVQGVNTTVVGGATVAVLPNTGAFRPLFFIGATMLAMGILMLVVAGSATIRQRAASKQSK
jgi:hypothetical protein